MSDGGEDPGLETARRTLALLHAQADAVRADLASLRRDLAQVKNELSGLRTTQLLEANQQLVQAAVHADSVAQTAVSSLDELTRSTQRDGLTGAPNRALMLDRLENAITLAQRRSTRVGVMFMDLDDFKRINDTLGHAVGDQVLQLAARRLESVVRESDSVSRHGGDEFVVMLAELSGASDATTVAEKVLAVLAAPAAIGPHTLSLSASIGISVYPQDGADAVSLIDRADAAMYRAKRRGPGGFAFWGEETVGESSAWPSAPAAAVPPATSSDAAFAAHEARLRELMNANHQLVEAAQAAQKLQGHAEDAHHRQIAFVAMAAHALRNPLSAIRMASTTLTVASIGESVRASQHQILQRQTALLARLVDDLLDGSRVGTREFRLERRDLGLDALIASAVDACRHAIDAKQQRLRLELPPQAPVLNVDPERLTQALGNLLNNASRRSPRGGDVSLSVAADGDQVVITVAGDGVGIAPEALPHIFDLFSLDTNVPLNESGLGVGLAVVQELVKAHGGTVTAFSAGADLGSEFVVRLPLGARAQ